MSDSRSLKISDFLRALDRHEILYGDICYREGLPCAMSSAGDYYILDAALRDREGLYNIDNFTYLERKYGYWNARDILNAIRLRNGGSWRGRWVQRLIDRRIAGYKAIRLGTVEGSAG